MTVNLSAAVLAAPSNKSNGGKGAEAPTAADSARGKGGNFSSKSEENASRMKVAEGAHKNKLNCQGD